MRVWLRRLHRWTGLATGLVVFIVGLSGAVYVWERELFALFHPALVRVQSGAAPLTADSLWGLAQAALPRERRLQQMTWHADRERAVMFSAQSVDESQPTYFSETKYYNEVYVDPYTGRVLGVVDKRLDPIWLTRMIHEHLLLGSAGTWIVGSATLLFIALCIVGVILWWPRTRAVLRNRWRPRLTMSWKRTLFDGHSILGVWLFVGLVIIAATGPVWTWRWYEGGIAWMLTGTARVVGEPLPAPLPLRGPGAWAPKSDALARVRVIVPDAHRYTIAAPGGKGGGLLTVGALYNRRSAWEEYERYHFDPATAELLGEETFDEKNLGMRWRNSNYGIHTGTLYGWPSQVLATIISLFAASLPVTGFLVWFPKWQRQARAGKRVSG